jgi:hypothetical protein
MRSLVTFALILATSCSSPTVKKVEHAALDCTKGELGKLEAIAVLLAPLIDGGVVPWSSVESAAIKAGAEIGGCTLAHLGDKVAQVASFQGPAGAELALAHLREATGTSYTYMTSRRAL